MAKFTQDDIKLYKIGFKEAKELFADVQKNQLLKNPTLKILNEPGNLSKIIDAAILLNDVAVFYKAYAENWSKVWDKYGALHGASKFLQEKKPTVKKTTKK